ncbi:cysteine--tRNA ligase CysS [Paenibacillus larvae subsp. larvae]|uniref:Cysteine--tRNA ligase n=1 Tax=Paenibacillus larvae subsp. larvae TaxID=147375 RepID=A0A2L1U6L4_9BACL|nr:cysteine--tRNA ligase [Paenibacillus larvae]AQT84816.1 cysteine--tRNA ligase [Paenibacillus larvae subsp. pulvifaciens]AQZ46810.1 cysteine--tRNA ligase [Paenibacillus larvae subsp. pulvifaciens]AVF28569.1 cysteine--tRNA ligase CysS [Paenibacillus larvae subsp. larvae]AVF33074.1 cysteine--tRNA ligase CysS [Paenibacillus larvae subsp. larvae]MBH0344248.1 cysteinyl-tRNA synthetase [Paenibacillus larvae]
MTLRMFNTMTREKEEFKPVVPGKVSMYVCGPTVYNYIHIGNGRPAIFFDVVRRYLTYLGYDVTYVVNFTDVDDKLIRKAEETGETVKELADRFIEAYLEDMEALGIRKADINPRVTENMDEIISFIRSLVDKGYAYENGGDVFYRTQKFADYGKLSHQNLDELQYGIRIEVDERKENPQDFVLWKAAKPGEVYWSSPWGNGRPGWHIECSALVHKYLGETIDIHGGGVDLTFPHHECEIAQTEALTCKPMAKYWLHNAFLNIDNEKMSKSLGNGVLVREILKRVKPQVLRLFMMMAHYRNQINFNSDGLEQAANGLERIMNSVTNLKHRLKIAQEGPADEQVKNRIQAIKAQFEAKMNDDFNTPDAITAVFELVSEANNILKEERVNVSTLEMLLDQFKSFDTVLGILEPEETDLMDEEIEKLIGERTEARRAKNWARADEIRDILTEKGILLEDTPQGIRWRQK